MRRTFVRSAATTFLAATLAAGGIAGQIAQQTPTQRLVRAEAALVEAFSSVRGVRELPSGALLVADWIEERVVLVDLDAGTAVDRVVAGEGPREVRLPSGLVPMPGDSTLLVDLGNQRLSVLGPDGRAARTIRADRPGMTGVRGVDAEGGLYFAIPAWAEGARALPDDSVRLVRLDTRTGATREVAVLQGYRSRSDARAPSMEPRIPVVGYAAQDSWALTPAGEVVIARGRDYHLDVIPQGGVRRAGPSYAAAPRAVTDADRRRFIEEFAASSPTSGRGPGGGMGHSPIPDEAEIARLMRTTEFAATHPHFSGGLLADSGGRVWVGRSLAPSEPAVYDVFDREGRRVSTVELLPGRRVMAVGRRGVYAVAESELGLQSLERYPLPR